MSNDDSVTQSLHESENSAVSDADSETEIIPEPRRSLRLNRGALPVTELILS